MKKYYKYIIVSILFIFIAYLFFPLSLKFRYNLNNTLPHHISITYEGIDNGFIHQKSIDIEDKAIIENLYTNLKEINLSRSFHFLRDSDSYVIHFSFFNKIKVVTIDSTGSYMRIGNSTYKVVDSNYSLDNIFSLIESEFSKGNN